MIRSLPGARRAVPALLWAGIVWVAALAFAAPLAQAQGTDKRVLLYTGTTGFRHSDAINNGTPVIRDAVTAAGYTVDVLDCSGNGGGANNCDNPAKNPAYFNDAKLATYDAIIFFNTSSAVSGGQPGTLWNADQRAAIIQFVRNGGGIAGTHNATDMGAGQVSWDWWDGSANSAVGTTMKGHGATSLNNVAQVQVADHHHLATRDLPDTYGFGDEHYNFARNVRGTHHVLATLDERTYAPGNPMGQDHPISWCRLYDGDNVNDGTGTAKSYSDGRVWLSGMGHFGASHTEGGGNNNLIKQIVGGVRWAAGEGKKSDCSGSVWSSFSRTVVVADANNPIGIDVAKDGKVFWSEIGNPVGFTSEGHIKMHDPAKEPGNKTTVATIPTRADHGNSEDGVLGMSLQPGFDLDDPGKRHLFVYYSPRPGPGDNWPTSGSAQVVGYNQISRFTLSADGTQVVPGSERVILKVPKAKISGSPSGFPGGPTDGGPGHVGGAGLDFDSAGNLYLGVGDDVSPNAPGHSGYTPMDHRAAERWDARKTSANSADLRGKILRIKPLLGDIPAGATPALDTTYTVPAGNLFTPGTPKTRPEIYAMGFRQPFTVQADPKNPGIIGTGEYCHDNGSNAPNRAPAGTCEWNLIDKAGNHGWPFCVGDNSAPQSAFRWNYAANATTGQQYNCGLQSMPSDIRWAPEGQTPVEPTFDGLDQLPGPAVPATIWKKYGTSNVPDFGDLGAGGMQPITGPIYRYDEDTAGPGAFPRYYDGSWLINNRGSNDGFWKEVQLREDNNKMLRVNDWLPYNSGSTSAAQNSSLVIGSTFSPAGELYLARFSVGCCRNNTNAGNQTQIVKVSFDVQDECLTDTSAPNASHELTGRLYPGRTDEFIDAASLKLTGNDVGCSGVKEVQYRNTGATEWQTYTDAIAFDDGGDYSVEYRAIDRNDNVGTVKTATFKVLEINDETAPTVTAATSGSQDARDFFVNSATLTLTAVDDETGSGIEKVEYRTNGGAYTAYTAPVAFNAAGLYEVDYRATDKVGNTSAVQRATFRVLSGEGCTPTRTDEFDGSTIDSRWLRHVRNGGTPTEGPLAPTIAGGKLTMPTNNFELDAASTTTAVGPVNFLGQDLPSLGDDWSVETQFTIEHTGGWQHAGLIVWNGDNNFFRSTITNSLSGGTIYVEQSKDNPTSTEGSRQQAGGNVTILEPAERGPVTIRMRYSRANGANTVKPEYRIVAPAGKASADWQPFPGAADFNDLNPSSGARRDAAGSRIGIIAAGNFPGSTGAYAYNGTPAKVEVDYFRVTPDIVDCESSAPTTTATLDPAAPGAGQQYGTAVKVDFSATDGAAGAAGVDTTEYRVITNGTAGEWQSRKNTAGAEPFTSTVTVSRQGAHVVEYRSTDKALNTETAKSIAFSIELPECLHSDEFDGTSINPLRWTVNRAAPAQAITIGDGKLSVPVLHEIDGGATGPLALLGQQTPSGTSWTAEAKVTLNHQSSWQQAGIMLWQSDTNFVKVVFSRNSGSGARYFEVSADNPPSNTRNIGQSNPVPSSFPSTAWVRMIREGNVLSGQYSADGETWTTITGNNSTKPVNTTPAREGEGVVIGPYAGSDIDGTFESRASFEYFKITPDDCPTGEDTTAPVTTATAAPAAPNGMNGWYTSPVSVTLAGTDAGSGIDKTEYRVDGGTFATYANPISVSEAGTHTVEYRSVDKAGNAEATKSLTVKVDGVAPTTTAALDPASPGTGGTYTGPVGLALTASDAVSGVSKSEYRVNAVGPFGAIGAPDVVAANEWVTYDAASKPSWTAPGAYTVDYRSTDNAGNLETAKTVGFTIAAPSTDTTAPVTTGTLDPASPGAGKTYAVPVTVKLSATDPAGAGPEAKTVNVDAEGDRWAPDAVSLVAGDQITWRFGENANFPHDVWVVPPGGNPNPNGTDMTQVTDGIVFPGGAPVSKTLTQTGAWSYICKVHAQFTNGAWSGMVGTANVTPATGGDAASGVDFTEYRVKTGDTQGDWVKATNTGGASPFASSVTISAEGQHTVEYRSVDKAGNAEAAKTVAFGIDAPDPGNPVIQAFADPAQGAAPMLVRFTASGFDPDGGALDYKWEFADGVSFGRAVTRTYTKAGTYTGTVTATDDEGETTSQEVTVTVTEPGKVPPTVEAGADVSGGPATLKVQFTAAGDDPDGPEDDLLYTWDFGDGGTSLAQHPAHTYMEPGTYAAKVTVSDASGATATDTVTITVSDPPGNRAPTVEPAALPGSGVAPFVVQLSARGTDPDGDSLTYEWDFDDGSPKHSGRTATHTYTSPGTYDATVTVSDGHGGQHTATLAIVVGNPPGNQAPTIRGNADPRSGTAPLTVEFSSHAQDPEGAGLLYVWSFGDGGQAAGATATHTYTQPGTYTATVTVTDPGGLTGSATVQVVVSAAGQPAGGTGGGVLPAGTLREIAPLAPVPAPWFGVNTVARTTVATLGKRGLSVVVSCTRTMTGSAKLTLSSKTRKALGLKRATLATGKIRCLPAGAKELRLKPSKAIMRALGKAKGSVKVKLGVSLKAKGKRATRATRTITITRR